MSAPNADEALRGVEACIDSMARELREARESARAFDRFTHAQQGVLMDLREAVEDRQTVTATLEAGVRAGCDRLCAALVAELRGGERVRAA